MLRRAFLLFCILTLAQTVARASEADLERLDSFVARRPQYAAAKQRHIDALVARLHRARTDVERLHAYNRLFEAYYTFRFDSAMVYVKRGLQLAERANNAVFIDNFRIHRGLLLATGGYYSQALAELQRVNAETLHPSLRFNYYYSMAWLYNFWASYCNDHEFAPQLARLRLHYLRQAISYAPRGSAMYNYLTGEAMYYGKNDPKAIVYYNKVLQQVGLDDRLYASAAYAMARGYKTLGRIDLYEYYLVQAGISDQVCPLKENLALQELSLYLYEKDKRYSDRAVRYIYCSMEDAQFYNNRLRMLEISRILPKIVSAYQQQLNSRTTWLRWGLVGLSVLSVGLLALIVLSVKQNKKLNLRRLQMRAQNTQLEALNQQLSETNRHRETYLRLFLDLSAIYIGKLDSVSKLVARCLKAGKTDELLAKVNRVRVQEEEARTFYDRFDRAFIMLYPDFVKQFNGLLRDDAQILPPSPHALTTELRIFALMRLGVTSSQEIATLLFYSTQTIYNYKSGMKARAKLRDTFEADVYRLCHVIDTPHGV